MFVLSLKKDYYFVQFSLFAWTHMALLLLDIAGYCLVSNLFEVNLAFTVQFIHSFHTHEKRYLVTNKILTIFFFLFRDSSGSPCRS